ncbi:unnamed protein product [Pieris brassicae]|uniref:Uncharacterized protein n=1 Tax=Pieris brassicae TaxID=7116 RepID=A0A9P0TB21_PIEBR|nr:unnamed protein product [Pieris brassicae]
MKSHTNEEVVSALKHHNQNFFKGLKGKKSNSSMAQQFIEQMVNSPGIYFDPIGSLNQIDSYLSVVVPIDVSYIKPHLINLQRSISYSKLICEESLVFNPLECKNLFQPVIIQYEDMTRYSEAIPNLASHHSTKRNALVGVIGTISKKLFGTMDEEDAIRYDGAVREIQSDEKKIASFVKENIIVTTSALKTFNKSINIVESNQREISDALSALRTAVENITIKSRELKIHSRVLELVSMIGNNLLTISFKIQDLVESIMFSKSNALHPGILTPKELYTELINNYRFIPPIKKLPTLLSLENIHTILNISTISGYMTKNELVFVLHIPLLNPIDFLLYHNLPYPTPHNVENPTSYSTIIPSSKYIGLSNDKSLYCRVDELQKCKIINRNTYPQSKSKSNLGLIHI